MTGFNGMGFVWNLQRYGCTCDCRRCKRALRSLTRHMEARQ